MIGVGIGLTTRRSYSSGITLAGLFAGGRQGFILDAANSTKRQERTGASATTPSASGDPVGSIRDVSPNGHWFTVPTNDTKRPVFTSAAASYLAADGTDDEMNGPAALNSVMNTKDFCVMSCLSNMVAGAERMAFSATSSTYVGVFASQGDLMSVRSGSFFNAGASQASQVAGVHVWTWNCVAGVLSCYRDGVQQGSSITVTGTITGSQAFIFSRNALNYTQARMYGQLALDRSLSGAELAAATTLIGAMGGLTL